MSEPGKIVPLSQSVAASATKKPATRRGEATRARLLAAAEAEFGQKGYHAASVSGITTEAGVGQGTFYLYFASKEEAFRALVDSVGRGVRRAMAEAVTGATDQMAAERLGLEGFVRYVSEHPHLYRIVQESQFVDESLFRRYYENLAAGYTRVLDAAAARGELTAGDAESRAWAIMGIGHFLGLRFAAWQGREVPAETLDAVMDLLSHGMAPR